MVGFSLKSSAIELQKNSDYIRKDKIDFDLVEAICTTIIPGIFEHAEKVSSQVYQHYKSNYFTEWKLFFIQLQSAFMEEYQVSFQESSQSQKTYFLSGIDADAFNKLYEGNPISEFFVTYVAIKGLCVDLYFTSEYVVNNLLVYNRVPGKYIGKTPYVENMKLYYEDPFASRSMIFAGHLYE